ncbi:S1C family serine protease [Demequina sp.]|uniref:S1C family serine protease n=1 Tax=Demequina sp. TaxID=2050685 RepID=UPI003D09C5CF
MSDNPFASPEDLSAQGAGTPAVPQSPNTVITQELPDTGIATPVTPTQARPDAVVAFPIAEPLAPAATPPARARLGAGAVAAIAGGALILGALGGFGAAFAYDQVTEDSAQTSGTSVLPAADSSGSRQLEDGSVAQVAAAVLPSVVSIEASSADGRASTGSGFVVREDGYIVTNNHVVEGADGSIKVLFEDGTIVDASVVGTTADYDLAVLKIDKTGLTPLTLADSDQVVVGDPVIAIGSPLGLDSTVTTGIVSSLHRPVTTSSESGDSSSFMDAIQTDAAINPGNSGGPLIDSAGQVIGINSAIASTATSGTQAGSVGLGFAIPSNQVRRTVEELIATGTATYPVIGVMVDGTNQDEGVLVATEVDGQPGVVPGGPADEAGIKGGDIITAIDGRAITRSDDLVVAIRAKAPGDTVTLTVKRDGKEQDITVTLASNTDVSFGDEDSEQQPAPNDDDSN